MNHQGLKLPDLENQVINNEDVKNFKKFALKQGIIEVSVAVVIGNAFNNAVNAFSNFLIMPIVNYLLSSTGGNWRDFKWHVGGGIVLEIGKLLGSLSDSLLTAALLYIVYYKIIMPIVREISPTEDKTTKPPENNNGWDGWYPK